MRKGSGKILAAILALSAAFLTIGFFAKHAGADISNPHPTPPANSVTSTMLVNASVIPSKIDSTQAYTFASSTSGAQNVGVFVATTSASIPGTTTINNVAYHFTATQGTAGQNLQNDGNGNVSWQTATNFNLQYAALGQYGITVTSTPIAVMASTTKLFSITFDQSSINNSTIVASPSISTSYTVGSGTNECTAIFVYTFLNNPAQVTLQIDGVTQTPLGMTGARGASASGLIGYVMTGQTAGSHTVSVTTTDNTAAGLGFEEQSYFGCAQSGQGTNFVAASSTSQSVTTSSTGGWFAAACTDEARVGALSPSSFTVRQSSGAFGDTYLGDSGAVVTAGGHTINGCDTTPTDPHIVAWEITPVNAGTFGFVQARTDTQADSDAFIGFITTTSATSASSTVYMSGIVTGFSNLVPGVVYYLRDTGGFIATTAGTITHKVGIALDAATLKVFGQ